MELNRIAMLTLHYVILIIPVILIIVVVQKRFNHLKKIWVLVLVIIVNSVISAVFLYIIETQLLQKYCKAWHDEMWATHSAYSTYMTIYSIIMLVLFILDYKGSLRIIKYNVVKSPNDNFGVDDRQGE